MDQNARYHECLERLTREMVSTEQIRVEMVYADLQELCKMLRVAKGVTSFYNSIIISKMAGSSDGFGSGFLMLFYIGGPIIGGGAYLIFKWLPEKENEKIIEKQEGIRFPNGLTPFSEKKYFAVEDSLRSAGFKNISCVNLHDLNLLTALVNSDKIDKITINGNTVMSGGKIYMPDVPIVITYHGR